VIDGQPLFRDAAARLVRQNVALALVGEAGASAEGLAVLRDERPDVALVDVDLDGLPGDRLLKLARTERLPTRIVLVGPRFASERAYGLLALGAAGFLTRSAGEGELRRAIAVVAAGSAYLADVQDALSYEIRLRADGHRPILSARELEILHRVAEGDSSRAIAAAMSVSPSTVKTHLTHLYEKLGAGDRASAVAAAMRRGLLR
jgi:two-component system nitrate/nitrite response regulator NarL